MRIVILTALAMAAFAANSVLARLAIGSGTIDALGYTGVRLAAGAALLVVLLLVTRRTRGSLTISGSWAGAHDFTRPNLCIPTASGALSAARGADWRYHRGCRMRV